MIFTSRAYKSFIYISLPDKGIIFVFMFFLVSVGNNYSLKSAELTDLDSVMHWPGSLTQPPLRFVVEILML